MQYELQKNENENSKPAILIKSRRKSSLLEYWPERDTLSLETKDFLYRPQIFLKDQKLFIGDPSLFIWDTKFSLKTQNSSF